MIDQVFLLTYQFFNINRISISYLKSHICLKFLKYWCPLKNREKSIRGFCPHRLCGIRQSLTKSWVQGNVCKNPLSAPSNQRIVPSSAPQRLQHLCQKPLHRPFIVDKCPLKGHFILKCFLKKIRQKQAILFLFLFSRS